MSKNKNMPVIYDNLGDNVEIAGLAQEIARLFGVELKAALSATTGLSDEQTQQEPENEKKLYPH